MSDETIPETEKASELVCVPSICVLDFSGVTESKNIGAAKSVGRMLHPVCISLN